MKKYYLLSALAISGLLAGCNDNSAEKADYSRANATVKAPEDALSDSKAYYEAEVYYGPNSKFLLSADTKSSGMKINDFKLDHEGNATYKVLTGATVDGSKGCYPGGKGIMLNSGDSCKVAVTITGGGWC